MRRRTYLAALGTVAVGGAVAAGRRWSRSFPPRRYWPEFGAAPDNGAHHPAAPGPSRGRVAWERTLSGSLRSAPVVAGDRVVVASTGARGAVRGLSAADGRTLWTARPGGASGAVPVVHGERLFLGDRDGKVRALTVDGTRTWIHSLRRSISHDPLTAIDGTVLVPTGPLLVSLTREGRVRWRAQIGGRPLGVAVDDGRAYAPTAAGRVAAVDLTSGAVSLSPPANARFVTPAVAADDHVLAGGWPRSPSPDGDEEAFLAALSTRTGRVRWRTGLAEAAGIAGPAVVGGTAVVATPTERTLAAEGLAGGDLPGGRTDSEGYVTAVGLASGRIRWRSRVPGGVSTPPAVAGGTVYVGGGDGVVGLSLSGGERVFSASLPVPPDRPLAIAGDRLYAATVRGRVVAVE